MKMMLFNFVFAIGILSVSAQTDCAMLNNPRPVIECLRYLTNGLYGVAIKDLKLICSIASDISNCVTKEIYDCIGGKLGIAALNEVKDLADYCCPNRNHPRCTIRDSVIGEQRCFAADSLVTLSNGQQKIIAHLQPGDSLLAYNDKTKQIISTHLLTMLDFQPHHFALFKQVTTISGRQLSLTSSHLLPTDQQGYVMAKNLRTGMNIFVVNDVGVLVTETISNVSDVVKQGYMAPLTVEGTLIVNNVAASCYATINSHHVAHAVLAPMRWWYGMFGISKESNEVIGVHWFPKMLYDMTAFLLPSIIHK